MSNKKITINVISSAIQVILVGAVYFFLYKLLIKHFGIELLGVWSVVLATSSLANLANFGVSTSVVRFVALYYLDADMEKIKRLIFTSVFFIFLFFLSVSIIVYPFAEFLLEKVIEERHINDALAILPYSMACLIINAVGGVYSSALDGFQRNYLRSIVFSFSSLLLLALSYCLIGRFGLRGVAIAQVLQSLFTLIACLILILKTIRHNPFKWRWDRCIFKEIFSYGMKFQIISISSMLYEPLTKILLAKFGGLIFTGYYEMANRLVLQVRGVIVNANQSLLPVIVDKNKGAGIDLAFYRKTLKMVLVFSLFFLTILCLSGGIVSLFWIGNYHINFMLMIVFLSFSVFFNLLNGPAYFTCLADGNLNLLLASHVILSILNLVLGLALGVVVGGYGVVIGGCVATIASSYFLIYYFNRSIGFSLDSIFDAKLFNTLLASIGSIFFQCFIIFVFRYKNIYFGFLELLPVVLFIWIFCKNVNYSFYRSINS